MKPLPRSLTLAAICLLALACGAGSAAASQEIEGVWSFNGGQVAVQAGSGGALTGTVVAPTRFTNCTHPVGERVWSAMKRQPDGSYWGLHQWYFNTEECLANPTLGLTAWRVLERPGGAKVLRVCFSEPGSTSQPTIAPDGTAAGATFGCSDSALVSPLPELTSDAARFPDAGNCLAKKRLRLKLVSPVSDPFTAAKVTLRSGAVKRRAKLKWSKTGVTAVLGLRGLAGPTFAVRARAETVLGHKLDAKRTYRLCGRKHHRIRSPR